MATMMWAWTYFEYSSGEYTQKFKEKGIQMTHLDQATLDKIQDLAYKYLLGRRRGQPGLSQDRLLPGKYFKDFAEWRTIQYPFMFGRTPPKLDELYQKLEALAKKHKVYDSVIATGKKCPQDAWRNRNSGSPGRPYVENPVTPK